MKRIIYNKINESGCAIIVPSERYINGLIAMSDEITAYESLAYKDLPRILPPEALTLWQTGKMSGKEYRSYSTPKYHIVDESEISPDREFRDAWEYDFSNDEPIKVNIEGAKEVHKDKLRSEREIYFKMNDLFLRDGFIYGDDEMLENAKIERQRLKDLPQQVDLCKTLDEIRAVKIG